eukprot:1626210-Amphidinium_carterae.1
MHSSGCSCQCYGMPCDMSYIGKSDLASTRLESDMMTIWSGEADGVASELAGVDSGLTFVKHCQRTWTVSPWGGQIRNIFMPIGTVFEDQKCMAELNVGMPKQTNGSLPKLKISRAHACSRRSCRQETESKLC